MKNEILFKLSMVGKATIYVLVLSALIFNSLFASSGNAQGVVSVKEARISIAIRNENLENTFRLIEKKTNYSFLYNKHELDPTKHIHVEIKDGTVEKLLLEISRQAQVSFRQVNERISVKSHTTSSGEIEVIIDKMKISGKVLDESNNPLPGATIVEKGTTNGTITDVDGNFSLEVEENATIVVSFVGYRQQEIQVSNQAIINVSLSPDVASLEEIVVVGYGTAKKSDVTGSLVHLSEEELKSRPIVNTLEALQGKAAGVDITSNERPGEIGQIYIRGVRSLTASNTPLYVVDGIPLMSSSGIETLNPIDIESIDILKDASATAIYGSRGANGVVLITTKRGKEGKAEINYTGAFTVENLQDRTEMMDANEYLTWRRWAYYYADPNQYPRGDEPTQANDFTIFLGGNDPFAWNNILRGWEGGTWDGSKVKTTDWRDMVTQTALTQTHSVSVSGGSEKVKAFGSFGYLDNQGTMKGQSFTRYSSKISVDLMPYEWFEMGVSINTSYSIQQFGQSTTGGQTSGPGSIYAAANGIFAYAVPFDDNGERITFPGGDDLVKTIVDEWEYTDNERRMLRTLGSLYAQFNIAPGLRYRVNFGPDFRYFRNGIFIDELSVNRLGSPNYVSLENQNDFSWTLDNLLYYNKVLGDHNVGITLLQTISSWDHNSSYMRAIGIPLPSQKWNALNLTNVPTLDNWDSNLTERQLMSYMARVNYGFTDRYLLTLSGRWDGASQLAEGHKWEFFPSAALAWIIDQESWMDLNWIDLLKVRLGVGTTGNSAIDPYQTKGGVVSLFYPYGSTSIAGYVPSEFQISGGNLVLANPELGWEKTTQYNIGLDFSMFKNRISGVIDVYTSRTKDLLMQMSIPPLTGFTTTYANVGETKNKGIDVTLNTLNVKAGSFTWETSFNVAWQKDEIVTLSNGKEDDISNNWFIGESVGITVNDEAVPGVIYGYESDGLWHEDDIEEMEQFNDNGHSFQVGMSRPVDQNGDNRINPNDDRVIIGHTRPRWITGMTNTLTYKNFDFSIFLYGRLDYTFNTGGEWQGGRYVQRSIDYYNENNKDAEYQKPIYNVAGGDPYFSILGYRNGSFIKIRNINLGYTLPAAVVGKVGISNLKVYIQAKNPGMLYTEIDWLDMDLGGSTWNRGYVLGLNAQF